jgi:hypothetical protein
MGIPNSKASPYFMDIALKGVSRPNAQVAAQDVRP